MKKKYDLKDICFNASNSYNDDFVGINYENNTIKVFFPIGYQIPDNNDECRICILNLIKTISLIKNINIGDKFGMCSGYKYELPVNSYLWLINDYLRNGLYFETEKKLVQNQNGKINWKKTLSTKSYVNDNNVIYLYPYSEKKLFQENIITFIHGYCIKKCIDEIGWLFGNIPIPNISNNFINNKKYLISIINSELIKSFDDRKKMLLINIKKVLDNSSDDQLSKSSKKYGTYTFEYIWEYLVNDIFGNENTEKFFPSASWHILDWGKINDSKLRPDTILSVKNDLYILDSKYYRFGVTGNTLHLPHTDSIQKQITYGEYSKNNTNYENIYNAFIMPYNRQNNLFNLNNKIAYVGFSKSNWKCISSNLYEHIALVLIDTKYLIDCYFNKENIDIISLIDSINEIATTFNN